MLSKNLEPIIPQLEELTRSLFPEILKIYLNPRSSTQEKKDGSPVTAADMYAHKAIVKFLKKCFPDIPIVSEENFKQKNYKPAKDTTFTPLFGSNRSTAFINPTLPS